MPPRTDVLIFFSILTTVGVSAFTFGISIILPFTQDTIYISPILSCLVTLSLISFIYYMFFQREEDLDIEGDSYYTFTFMNSISGLYRWLKKGHWIFLFLLSILFTLVYITGQIYTRQDSFSALLYSGSIYFFVFVILFMFGIVYHHKSSNLYLSENGQISFIIDNEFKQFEISEVEDINCGRFSIKIVHKNSEYKFWTLSPKEIQRSILARTI